MEIACVVGEASGDLLAAQALSTLKNQNPNISFSGIGGPALGRMGFQSHYQIDDLSVRGVFEVLRHYPRLKRMQNDVIARYQQSPPRLFLGVDAPDFNLAIEQKLKRQGIKTVHFIGPSIWAWRAGRIKKIQRAVNHMLLIFPFEEVIYRQAGIPATYVGHPLAQMIPVVPNQENAQKRLKINHEIAHSPELRVAQISNNKGIVITLMPGSRLSEIQYNAAVFARAAEILARQYPEILFLIPFAGERQRKLFEEILFSKNLSQFNWLPLMGNAHDAIEAADAVLVASGTATLEVALYKKPMVIAYKMLPATWYLVQCMRYQPWVGLPNILAQEMLVPELLQNEATPEKLAAALNQVLEKGVDYYRDRFTDMHAQLTRPTAQLVADTLLKIADE